MLLRRMLHHFKRGTASLVVVHVHVSDSTSSSDAEIVEFYIGKMWRGHCEFYFAIFRAMAGRGAISLAEHTIRPSTQAHTPGFGEARDVKGI